MLDLGLFIIRSAVISTTTVKTWPIRLIIACLLVATPLLSAASARADEKELMATLRDFEAAIWRDPWAARDRLKALRPELDGASSEVRALYYQRLAHALHYLYLDEEFSHAIDAGLAAVTPSTSARTRLFLELLDSVRLRQMGDYKSSLELTERVVEETSHLEFDFLSVFALSEMAFTRTMLGNNEVALIELQRAFADAVELQDRFLIAIVNEAFGALYSYIDEFDKSIEHYRKALDTYAELDYAVYEAEATYGIAISYRYAEQWDEALANFQRYREMTEDYHSEHGTFGAQYGLGMTYAEMGDCDNALPHIARALQTHALDDFKAELYKRQAVCLAGQGDAKGARGAIAAARAIFDELLELEGSRWEIEVLKARAQVEASLGNGGRAYELLLDYHEQAMALQSQNSSERLMTLRVEMEDARKDYEIELLKEEARVDDLKLEQQERQNRMQRWTTLSWIGTTFVAVVFLALQLRNTRRFRDLSSRDELTGLYNRRFIFGYLEKLTRELPLDRGELSIVLIDVDNFKRINDQYGHPAGDCILETMASLGLQLLRPGDEMARVGGEEFLCVLPRTSVHKARGVARRLLECIREHRFALPDGSAVQVTVSIGVASFGPGCRDADSLYAAADDAMYRAKTSGKDQLNTAS